MRTRTTKKDRSHTGLKRAAGRPTQLSANGLRKQLNDGDKDWDTPCINCAQLPTVHPVQLCGPCCFGEAATMGGNW